MREQTQCTSERPERFDRPHPRGCDPAPPPGEGKVTPGRSETRLAGEARLADEARPGTTRAGTGRRPGTSQPAAAAGAAPAGPAPTAPAARPGARTALLSALYSISTRPAPPRGPLGRAGRTILRYGVAVAAVAAALALTLGFWQPVFSRSQFALFYAAVIVAAWFGGMGPGLLATALAVWSIDYFILPTFISFNHGWHDLIQAAVFASVSVLVSSLDATRIRAMAALVAARDAAESANRAKDDFLAVLSHELRTPLTPALAAAAAMEQDLSLPAGARADVAMIRRNIDLEARLIDDLLDLTRITRGKLNLSREPLDVHALIGHVLDICGPDLRAKRLELSLLPGCAAPFVCADAARINQILWNLVKNAIKFTPEGGRVTIRTALVKDRSAAGGSRSGEVDGADARPGVAPPLPRNTTAPSPSAETLVVEVSDTGIGIEPHVLPRVFDAFEQGERTNSHRFGGLGLGLAISKALATAHGGDLTAASGGPGRGATFTLRLPAATEAPGRGAEPAPGPAPEPVPTAAAGPGAGPSPAPAAPQPVGPVPLRVLLVEDHADTARMMARLLRASRYEVRTAGSVRDALEAATGGAFDLLISDLGLPDGNGLELIRELRSRRDVEPFRAIALSGYGMEEDLRQTREAGFAAHLTKPISFQELGDAIGRVTAAA